MSPARLSRSTSDRKIAGAGGLLYLVLWAVLPEELREIRNTLSEIS